MTSEAVVIIAAVLLLSLLVIVAVAAVTFAAFDRLFKQVLIQKKHRDLHP